MESLESGDSKIGKYWFKLCNNTANLIKHFMGRGTNRLSVSTLAALKDVLKIDCCVHLHLRAHAETGSGKPCEYCAIFYLGAAVHSQRRNARMRHFNEGVSLAVSNHDTAAIGGYADDLHKAVLVTVVDAAQDRQCAIPCLVRLLVLDQCALTIREGDRDSAHLPGANVSGRLASEVVCIVTDGEIDRLGECRALDEPKLPDQVVQYRAQIITEVSQEQREVRRQVPVLLDADSVLSCISLSYFTLDNTIGTVLLEPLDQLVDDFEVLFCPAQLEVGSVQRVHMVYSNHEREEDAKDAQGSRDTHTHTQGLPEESRQSCKETLTASTLSELELGTEHGHPRGDYTAKHTRLGSPEDA
jgi:hypothetical protein